MRAIKETRDDLREAVKIMNAKRKQRVYLVIAYSKEGHDSKICKVYSNRTAAEKAATRGNIRNPFFTFHVIEKSVQGAVFRGYHYRYKYGYVSKMGQNIETYEL
jgi:hypothetical protein